MLIFLKLGGSLITDKSKPYTPKLDRIDDLARQIAEAKQEDQNLRLLLGHGSGSFGHTAAATHNTRAGVYTKEEWAGFSEVWYQATELNRLVLRSLRKAGLFPVTFSPSGAATAHAGKPFIWDTFPIRSALENGLLPIIHGDVVFDDEIGGTILSTEDLFCLLAPVLMPVRILLAGHEDGVWEDFPDRRRLLEEIRPEYQEGTLKHPGPSDSIDVTGGMRSKVEDMLLIVNEVPDIEAFIFSGCKDDAVKKCLLGEHVGTRICR